MGHELGGGDMLKMRAKTDFIGRGENNEGLGSDEVKGSCRSRTKFLVVG